MIYKVSCKCGVYREREWVFYFDSEPTVQQAREWFERESRGYADTTFMHIGPLKVNKI